MIGDLVKLCSGRPDLIPAASSSRSQVTAWTASAAACLAWEAPSIDVRWRPPLVIAIVTHLATRLASTSHPGRSVGSRSGQSGWRCCCTLGCAGDPTRSGSFAPPSLVKDARAPDPIRAEHLDPACQTDGSLHRRPAGLLLRPRCHKPTSRDRGSVYGCLTWST